MTAKNHCFAIFIMVMAVSFLAGCGSHSCPTTFITSSGGGGGGTVQASGNVCGSGVVTGGPSAAFVFFLDGSVETASIGINGSFQKATGITPPTEAGSVIDDMVAVNGKFLYLPYGDINGVQALTINGTSGALTTITGSPFLLPGGTADTAVSDPAGHYLFVGSEGTGFISVFKIDATTGALTIVPGSPFTSPNLFSADSLTVDSTGKFLYAGQLNAVTPLAAFSIDQNTGALSEIVGSPFNLGVAQLHADPAGNFLLGVAEIQDGFGSATDPHIHVFAIDPLTGVPTEVAGSPFATVASPFDFAISPNGKFVYTVGNATGGAISSIEGFQLDSTTGSLTPIAGSPFTGLAAATQCKFDQGGGLLVCATGSESMFSVFGANSSTGALNHTVTDLTAFSYPFAVVD